MAQALAAAQCSVPTEQPLDTLHAQFLRPGDTSDGIDYQVERVQDSRSTTQRRVVATQHGRTILTATFGFATREAGLDHQSPLPDVPAPRDLPSTGPRYSAPAIPEGSIDFRYVDEPLAAHHRMWFRAADPLPDDPALHTRVVTFVTDLYLCDAILRAHDRTPRSKDVWWGSTDHSMWWHRPARADDWLLLDTWSPSAAGGRGLVLGEVFSQDGTLVASLAQRNVVRLVS
jgi:acyl-CoA thioesterase-2